VATKLVKEQVEKFAELFRPFYNRRMQVQVTESGIIPFTSRLEVVRPATLVMMKGLEIKRPKENSGEYSPPSFVVEFEDGKLFFIMEDIIASRVNTSGVELQFPDYVVRFIGAES
jgi:hypothetical protein